VTRLAPLPSPSCEPLRLLPGLPEGCGVRLLEARGEGGWASPAWGSGQGDGGLHLLGLEPEIEFRGGREALVAALEWLQPREGLDPWERVLIGSLSYELGAEIESALLRPPASLPPPVDLAGFRALYLFDPRTRRGRVEGGDARARARLTEQLCRADTGLPTGSDRALPRPKDSLDRSAFMRGVEAIREWIRRGDVYQVNLSRRLSFPGVEPHHARELYARLSGSGEAPFAAYLESSSRTVLSNSPERFLRVAARRVETCPIKGTRPRGSTPDEDRRLARALSGSEKDAAEHLMIVDLERNDLGRICEIGSVRVEQLAGLRSFASVHHLVSSVQGRLRAGVGALELLAATFPGGSITGAPKVRAMQIIAELEPVGRDVYTGAIGYFDAAGGLDLSVAIRTAVLREGELHLHVGGGIVADSDARAEWLETEAKSRAFRELWRFEA
jgi:para-aminobenzoate synthetase component 1